MYLVFEVGSHRLIRFASGKPTQGMSFFQAEDGIRDHCVTGVQTCALPISITTLRIQRNLITRGQDGKPEKENWVLMRGIWISAATIARFAVAGSLTLLAGGQSAPKADPPILRVTGPATVAGESADRKLVIEASRDVVLRSGQEGEGKHPHGGDTSG